MSNYRDFVPTAASSTFPNCAINCQILLEGQVNCLPPIVATGSQLSYDQCFCQSPWLTPFYSTPDSVCFNECTNESDRQELQAWYKQFCVLVSQGTDPTAPEVTVTVTAATSTATSPTSTSTSSSSRQTNGANSQAGSSGASQTSGGQSWIDGHWQWIVGICLIIAGLVGFTFFVLWLRRRHRRKVEKRRSALSGFKHDPEKRAQGPSRNATQELWGPHQMMQATQGYQYVGESGAASAPKERENSDRKGKGRSDMKVSEVAEPEIRSISSGKSSRARPEEMEKNARLMGAADRHRKSLKGKSKMRDDDGDGNGNGNG